MLDITEIYGIRNSVKKVCVCEIIHFFTVRYLQDTQGNDQTGNLKVLFFFFVLLSILILGVVFFISCTLESEALPQNFPAVKNYT